MAFLPDNDYVFEKKCKCPVCGANFTSPTVKSSKARMVGSDMDLRPKYENINVIKYDAVVCKECGYSALERYFKDDLKAFQKENVKTKITTAFTPREMGPTLSYEEAFYRYKMAFISTVTKEAAESEKAYVCLKSAWLLRGWREQLEADGDTSKSENLLTQEKNYLKNAKEGFEKANISEDYPLAGMDENTVDYLLAALSFKFEEYDTAMKLCSGLIADRGTNPRVKERARDLKDEIAKKQKELENTEEA